MSDVALACAEVSKKFRKGESFDSLRDFIPAMLGRSVRRASENALKPKEFWALRDLSFEVVRGEALGVIGHNGAGKSTLLKLLSGIMKPTSGSITINGKLSALIEVGAGFHDDLTGRENVFLNGVILGMSRAEIARKFDEIVALLRPRGIHRHAGKALLHRHVRATGVLRGRARGPGNSAGR